MPIVYTINGHSKSLGNCRRYLEEAKGGARPAERGGISGYLEKDSRIAVEAFLNIEDRDYWDVEMDDARKAYGKNKGVTFYHFILSPDPRDSADPEDVARYAVEWARDRFGEGAQVAVAVHEDTGKPHAHVVVNNLDLGTGKKIHRSKTDIDREWDRAQEIAVKHGLRPMPRAKDMGRAERRQEERGCQIEWRIQGKGYVSWRAEIRQAATMAATDRPRSFEDYQRKMRSLGYDVYQTRRGGYTYRHPKGYRCKDRNMGTLYEPIALIPAFREASDRRRDEMTVSERFADARAQVERNERRGRAYYGQKDIESRLRGLEAIRIEGTADVGELSARLEKVEEALALNARATMDKSAYLGTVEAALSERAAYAELQARLEKAAVLMRELPREDAETMRKALEPEVERYRAMTEAYAARPDLDEGNLSELKERTETELDLMKARNIDLIDRKLVIEEAVAAAGEYGPASVPAHAADGARAERAAGTGKADDLREPAISERFERAASEAGREVDRYRDRLGAKTSDVVRDRVSRTGAEGGRPDHAAREDARREEERGQERGLDLER